MNRTIEQWQKVDCEHVAKNASQAHVMYLLQDAVSDLQELARQRDELLAATERFNEAYKTWNGGMAQVHFSTAVVPADFCKLSAVYEKIKEQTK